MSTMFKMSHQPAYQYRTTTCNICSQPIRPGTQVIISSNYYKIGDKVQKRVIREHHDCFWQVFTTDVAEWYHLNDFAPEKVPYSRARRLEILRLNARLWYLRKKGVGDNDLMVQMILQRKAELQNNGKEKLE